MRGRLNFYLLCDITLIDKGKHFIIPIPLFVVDALFEGWWLIRIIVKKLPHEWTKHWVENCPVDVNEAIEIVVKSLSKLWSEMRWCGKFSLVDIETKSVRVKLNFI